VGGVLADAEDGLLGLGEASTNRPLTTGSTCGDSRIAASTARSDSSLCGSAVGWGRLLPGVEVLSIGMAVMVRNLS